MPGFSVKNRKDVGHPFRWRKGTDDINVEFFESTIRYVEFSWIRYIFSDRCRVANMRPGSIEAQRPPLGRPTGSNHASDRVDDQSHTDENKQNNLYAQLQNESVTQPFISNDRNQRRAEIAGFGGQNQNTEYPSLHHALQSQYTGPPPYQPFTQQQNSSPALPANSGPTLQGPATSSPQGYGSHLCPNEPPSSPTGSAELADHFSTSIPAELADHDYTSTRPPPITDHNYFMSVPLPDTDPRVRPPPGFTYPPQHVPDGRPKRNVKIPQKLHDYDLS